MVESFQSAIVIITLAFMVGVVGWVTVTNYQQLDLSDVLSLRLGQSSQEESTELAAPPAVLGDQASQQGEPVELVDDFPVVRLPRGASSVFAP